MNLLPKKLTPRLVLSHLFVGLLGIGLISSIAGVFIMDRGRSLAENALKENAFLISSQLEEPYILANGSKQYSYQMSAVIEPIFAGRSDLRYTLYTNNGQIIATNEPYLPDSSYEGVLPEITKALKGEDGVANRQEPEGGEAYFVAVPVIQNQVIYGALRISALYTSRLGATYRTLTLLAIISVVLVIFVAIEAFWLASSLAKPIRALTATAEQFSQGKLDARAKPEGPDELNQLANSFNLMAVTIQNNINGLRAFVANASHELRTPLTAVKLHIDALSDGAVNDPAVSERFFSQIQDELNLMSRTVTDLLDLSRIEAGRDRSDFEMIELNDLVSEAGELWYARAHQNGLQLYFHLSSQPATIFANEDMLRRLINNLVDNAVKNTPAGGSVDISILPEPEQKLVRLEVKDTGIGIKEEHLLRIFERFYRVAPTQMRSAKTAGSGLGLAIAKSIMDLHEGKIGVQSKFGEGTTFWAEFALQRPKYEETKTQPRKIQA